MTSTTPPSRLISDDLGECLLRISDVQRKTGLGRTTIYRFIKTQGFPAPVALGPNSVRWKLSEVDEWIKGRPVSDGPRVQS